MVTGREISVAFVQDSVWPLLQREFPDAYRRMAVAVIGIGSDVSGYDDDVSRDHHWGPRANVMLLPEDRGLLPEVEQVLDEGKPETYAGYRVFFDRSIYTGLCCCCIDDFFEYFLGTPCMPELDVDWVRLCETNLEHVTGGVVVEDPAGELTQRRAALAYYPDTVWRKRIADWCMYLTGRNAPYNLHRTLKRGDTLTGALFKANYLREAMELCFALNRRYAPHAKWLNRAFRRLPRFVDDLAPCLDAIAEEHDLALNVQQMIACNYLLAEAIAELGLADRPVRAEFDDNLTVLTLYDSAAQIYGGLPEELLRPSFNRVEMWEWLVRDALFGKEECHNTGRTGGPAVRTTRSGSS